jgi:hypothetical protein
MNKKIKAHLRPQRGIAMIIALLALVLLSAIGMALMFMADTENSVNNNYRDSQKAYFAARAGAEEARLLLVSGPLKANAMALTMPISTAPTGILYLKNPTGSEPIDPTTGGVTGATLTNNPFMDDQLCWEKFTGMGLPAPTSTSGPCTGTQLLGTTASFTPSTMAGPGTSTATALPFKWVRVTNKQNLMASGVKVNGSAGSADNGQQVCWDGSNEVVTATTCDPIGPPATTPVWEITSLAVTPGLGNNPGSRRIVQMEVAFNPPLIPPAPISVQAPVNLQGSYVLNAYDNCSCTCTTTGSGNNQVTTCGVGQPNCKKSAHAIYTQNTVSVTGGAGQTQTNFGTDPATTASVQNVNPWPNSLNIDNLINKYKSLPGAVSPNYSCTGTPNFTGTPEVYKNCGTQTSQQFGTYPTGLPVEPLAGSYTSVTEYIPGSVKLTSAASGSGILIVDGDLEINGGLNWYGLILVRGKVSFTGGAGASTNMYGAILAGDDVNATNQSQTDTFGGSINFHYDVCALSNLGGSSPPQMLATHEIMY